MSKRKSPAEASALAQYEILKMRITENLARLSAMDASQLNVAREDVHYGHVGDLLRVDELLNRITDQLYFEGEHAPEGQ
jgi:hypothetical protein